MGYTIGYILIYGHFTPFHGGRMGKEYDQPPDFLCVLETRKTMALKRLDVEDLVD
jgi:hypothetical protein